MAAVQEKMFFPISEISTYQTSFTICARVTNKSQLRTFNKSGKDGKVFSIDLLDAQGGEIRATFFNEIVDKMYEKLKKGKCYTFSKGGVRIANRQFNMCNHRYELVFDKMGEVEEVKDDARIETVKFSFTDLRRVQSRPLPCTVDLCGVITSFESMYSFTSKDGKNLVKREITIADDTAISMGVTLWGERAQQEDSVFQNNPVACLKGVSVKEWNGGRSGSLLEAGMLQLNPTLPEATKVKQWWSQGGSTQELTALTAARGSGGGMGRAPSGKPMDITDMRQASEQVADQAEVYTVNCRLANVQSKKNGEPLPFWYMACQEPKQGNGMPCNRRLDSSGFCASCDRSGKAAPRLTLRCRFSDYGDSCWLTTFHEPAQKVIGLSGEQAQAMEQGEDGRKKLEAAIFDNYFGQLLQVTIRAKLDSYNGEPKANITCIDARPVSKGERGRVMLKEIQDMLN
jgi:replication factor A1